MVAVYRWEVAKLLAQKRTYLGLGAAMLIPLAFVVVLVVIRPKSLFRVLMFKLG